MKAGVKGLGFRDLGLKSRLSGTGLIACITAFGWSPPPHTV